MTELKEKKFKVTPCYTKAFCSKCNVELVMESFILPTNPYTYKYKCPKCDEIFLTHNQYPTVEYTLDEEIVEDRISELKGLQQYKMPYAEPDQNGNYIERN